jgi:hypothetical protein
MAAGRPKVRTSGMHYNNSAQGLKGFALATHCKNFHPGAFDQMQAGKMPTLQSTVDELDRLTPGVLQAWQVIQMDCLNLDLSEHEVNEDEMEDVMRALYR